MEITYPVTCLCSFTMTLTPVFSGLETNVTLSRVLMLTRDFCSRRFRSTSVI